MWFSSSNLKAQVIKHWKMLAFFSSPPTSWPNLNSKVFEACKMSHYFAHGAGKWTSSIPVVWENEVNPSCFVFIKKQWAKKISQSDSQRERAEWCLSAVKAREMKTWCLTGTKCQSVKRGKFWSWIVVMIAQKRKRT